MSALKFLGIFLILQNYTAFSYRTCDDCVVYKGCREANVLIKVKKSETTRTIFGKALCGFHGSERIVKVCCSEISRELLNHLELKSEVDQRIYDVITSKTNKLPLYCGDTVKSRIVGGRKALAFELPWMALIVKHRQNVSRPFCGGTIIHSRYILTAAHCDQPAITVHIGDNSIFKGKYQKIDGLYMSGFLPTDLIIQNIIKHEHFNKTTKENDIALIQLSNTIRFDYKRIAPICLPTSEELQKISLKNVHATIAGWGTTETEVTSQKLRTATVSVFECKSFRNKICANNVGVDSCSGDSGGPLTLETNLTQSGRYVQIGIVSHGPPNCGNGALGVYTDVRKYIDWILNNIS